VHDVFDLRVVSGEARYEIEDGRMMVVVDVCHGADLAGGEAFHGFGVDDLGLPRSATGRGASLGTESH
jgi:hypothetical protein